MINFERTIEKGLDKLNESDHEWNNSRIHISDLAVGLEDKSDRKCNRQVWLRYNGYEKKDNNAGTKLMFKQGDNLHDLIGKILELGLPEEPGSWKVIGIEEKVELAFITGRYDCQIKNEDTGARYIIDFKTVRGGAFNYLNKPKGSHTIQVQSYVMAEDADGGFVIYIDREGQNFIRAFSVKRNDEKVKRCIDVAKGIAETEIPPAILEPKIRINENKGDDSVVADLKWQCKYCDFYGVSCEGSVPQKYRDNLGKVVGHLNDEGEFTEKIDGISQYLEEVI